MALFTKNLVKRSCGFQGGLYLSGGHGRSAARTIGLLPTPPVLHVLMQQHDGPPAAACVMPGERVRAGQPIGRAESDDGLDVHSPVAGRIIAVARADSARHNDVVAVQIETDRGPSDAEVRGEIPAPARIPANTGTPGLTALIEAAESAGLTDFQPRPHGLGRLLRRAAGQAIHHLIIDALPGEPISMPPTIEATAALDNIVKLAGWIGRAVNARRVWLAVDRDDRYGLRQARAATHGTSLYVVSLPNKYPQHLPAMLAASVTRLETPPGGTTLDVGVVTLGWQSLRGLAEALPFDGVTPRPMTHREISVTGPAVAHPGCYRIPLGTSFEHILGCVGLREVVRQVIQGSPLTGQAVSHLDVVVTKETSALLVLDDSVEQVPSPGPCIRCGWCQEDCPVGLDPQAILDLTDRDEWAAAARSRTEACVECGLCSYVCPAELPLAETVIRAKRMLKCAIAPQGRGEKVTS